MLVRHSGGVALCLLLTALLQPLRASWAAGIDLGDAVASPPRAAPAGEPDPGRSCALAVRDAERRYHLPPGLLLAISQVESGRMDIATHQLHPWPWTVQAENQSLYFASKADAVRWVQQAQSRGVTSIDTGCLQVNLYFHARAFQSVDDAFDPETNADYAARFLLVLHASAGDWQTAAGLYHSQTASRAIPYRARVMQALSNGAPPAPEPQLPTALALLSDAWTATLEAAPTD